MDAPRTATRKHSFAPVTDARTRLLVLGSLPGDRSLAEQRYYAHPQNQFWRLLAPVAARADLPALPYEARLAVLLDAGIGLWDVLASAARHGSSDAAIRDAAGNDLAALVATLPGLQAIAFNGAAAWRQGSPRLAHAGFDLVSLPSSSPLHTIGIEAKRPAWNALRRFLDPSAPQHAEHVSNS